MSSKRILFEITEASKNTIDGIRLIPNENDTTIWKGYITGPQGTPYYGYILTVDIKIPPNYPLNPPNIKFHHFVFHPNVSANGEICLDILKTQWTPTLTLGSVLLSLCSLLNDPNPDSALNGEAGRYWKTDRKKYDEKVKEFCEKHCQKIA